MWKLRARFVVAVTMASLAQSAIGALTILHSFHGGPSDGYSPLSGLAVSGSTLYGTTRWGGDYGYGTGTVFRIDSDGSNYSIVHRFSSDGSEGTTPWGDVAVVGSTVYGNTPSGGLGRHGTIFKVNTDGSAFSVLHTFPALASSQGGYNGITASGSQLYGLKPVGGANNAGFVYKYDIGGAGYSTLYSFQSGLDGYGAQGDVILAGSQLYGMTGYGGGVLFRCNTDGSGYTRLHRFGNPGDGVFPFGSLLAVGSALYGMTETGGASNDGTIFRINTDGTGYSILHSFSNGEYPVNGSFIADGSKLYGMSRFGGAFNFGQIFQIDTAGSGFQVLHSFSSGPTDGRYPHGDLAQIGSTLYGTAAGGGAYDGGIVFSFNIPEPGCLTLFAGFTVAAMRRRKP